MAKPSLADTELCPAAYWEHQGCHFIICKTGDSNYRCQLYYRVHQM